METRHVYGLLLRRLGSGPGFVTSLGLRRGDGNLNGPRRVSQSTAEMRRLNRNIRLVPRGRL